MIYFILILFSVNFMLCEEYILVALFTYQCMKTKKIKIDTKFFVLVLFSVVYLIVLLLTANRFNVQIAILPVAYLLGYNLNIDKKEPRTLACSVLVCLSLGMCLHIFLNFCAEIIKYGGIKYGVVHYDIWSGNISSSTGQMINYTFAATILTYIIVKNKKHLLALLLIIPSLLFGVIVGSRTSIVISIISVLTGLIVLCFNVNTKKARVSIAMIIALMLFVVFALQFNIFGISDIIGKSYLMTRLDLAKNNNIGALDTERWQIKLEYIKKMLEHPWGGGSIRRLVNNNYAHDLLLDVYSEGGIMSFLLMAIYLIMLVKSMICFIKKSKSLDIKVLFIPFLIVVLMQMMLEPILEGAPVFMLSLVMIDGLVTNVNKVRCEDESRIHF